jgi:hypothetical protein
MLLVSAPVTTPHGLSVTGTVWRWLGLSIDPAGGAAVVVLCAYPTAEIASAAGTPTAKPALVEERYEIRGADFLAVASRLEAPTGAGKPLSQVVYDHFRATVPRFAGAADVDLVPPAGA